MPLKDGYPTVDDCYNTAREFAIKLVYPSGIQMVVDSRSPNGVLFEGTKGRIFVSRDKIAGKPIEEEWDKGKFGWDDMLRLYKGKPAEVDQANFYRDATQGPISHLSGVDTMVRHKANFYRCIREGGLPISDVFSHVQTMNTCHLCAIAARLGRTIHWDPMAEKIIGDDQAAAFFARTPRPGFEIPRV